MATYFLDNFDGSGALSAHTPDTGLTGGTWNSGYASNGGFSLDGSGNATPVASTPASISKERYVASTPTPSVSNKIEVTLTGTSRYNLDLLFVLDSQDFYVKFYYSVSNSRYEVTMYRSGTTGLQQVAASASPSLGSPHTAIILYNSSAQTISLTVAGVTYSTSTSAAYTPAAGITDVEIGLYGSGSSIGLVTMQRLLIGSTGGEADVLMPAATSTGYAGGGASLTSPTPTATGTGSTTMETGSIASAMPSPDVYSIGHSALGERELYAIMPMPLALSYGGGSAETRTSSPQVGITATVWGIGTAAAIMSKPTLGASGTVSAMGRASIQSPVLRMSAYAGAVAAVEIGGKFYVAASGMAGGVGGAALVLPLYDLTASGSSGNVGGAIISAPMPRLATTGAAWVVAPGAQLTAIGSAVVTVSYEAYALNLKHNTESVDELTRYTNYPFDRIVRYQNSYYGMNSTGLYLLEGTTDFAEPTPTPIAWSWKTTLTDFDSAQLKTVQWAYFGGRMGPNATISIHYGDMGQESYAYASPRGSSAQNYRQGFGRGIKSRYYAIGASGVGELSLDHIVFNIAMLARKV